MAINLGTGQLCTVCGRPTPWTDWTKCEEHNHSTLQPIPTVRDTDLVRLFDSARATSATVVINSTRPGVVKNAAELLPAWARGVGLEVEEHVYPSNTPHLVSWVNLHLKFGPSTLDGSITIIQSRAATEADIARHNASLNVKGA